MKVVGDGTPALSCFLPLGKWRGNVFGRVVYLSVCSVCVSLYCPNLWDPWPRQFIFGTHIHLYSVVRSSSYIEVNGSRSRSQKQRSLSMCRKPLQSEAGESKQSLSYVHNVLYAYIIITIQWSNIMADCGGPSGRVKGVSVCPVRGSSAVDWKAILLFTTRCMLRELRPFMHRMCKHFIEIFIVS